MNKNAVTLETLGYLLAFALAVLVRFVGLGNLPLSEREAELAMQALAIARGSPVVLEAQPGYLVLTSLLFSLFGASDGLARFWPALAGSLLVAAPFLFRRALGRWPALILAFALALEPGLAAVARTAGGASLALTGAVLALAFALHQRPVVAGVFAALALLGGPALWPGVVAVALALVVFWLARVRWAVGAVDGDEPGHADTNSRLYTFAGALAAVILFLAGLYLIQIGFLFLSAAVWLVVWYAIRMPGADETTALDRWDARVFPWRTALVALLAAVLVAGTLFLRVPAGLSALGGSLPEWLRGFAQPSDTSAPRLLLALIVYQPLALVFGLWRIIANLSQRNRVDAFLSILWFISAGLAMLPAARQVSDLAWSLLPLWALAARQIALLLQDAFRYDRLAALAQTVLQFVLLVFIAQNLLALNNDLTSMVENPQVRLVAIAGAVILMVLTAVMMGIGWSWHAARTGVVLGLGLGMALYMISALSASAGLNRAPSAELYRAGSAPRDQTLLVRTVQDLALFSNGNRNLLDVVVVDAHSPSLEWALRDMEQVDFVNVLPSGLRPSVVITGAQVMLAIQGEYRGQDFYWTQEPPWEILTPREWINWLFYRRTPQSMPDLILWARGDLFYGGVSANPPQP